MRLQDMILLSFGGWVSHGQSSHISYFYIIFRYEWYFLTYTCFSIRMIQSFSQGVVFHPYWRPCADLQFGNFSLFFSAWSEVSLKFTQYLFIFIWYLKISNMVIWCHTDCDTNEKTQNPPKFCRFQLTGPIWLVHRQWWKLKLQSSKYPLYCLS